MKPSNPIYVGGPPLEPPDEEPLISCMFCKKRSPRYQWIKNHNYCPACNEEDAAGESTED